MDPKTAAKTAPRMDPMSATRIASPADSGGRPAPQGGSGAPVHGHVHAHPDGHSHHSHAPDHIHPPADPARSILRMSLAGRLTLALAASAVIWSALFLAVSS